MSLATRCTACGTIFRIVEDQLRVSDGWVRCGRCAEIFDARELLFDIEQESPPPWPAQFSPAPATEAPSQDRPPEPPATRAAEPTWTPAEPEPEIEASQHNSWPHESERLEPRWVDDDAPAVQPPPSNPVPPPAFEPPPFTAQPLPSPAVVPEFMRRAESSARWNTPAVRVALGFASAMLALLLLLQLALHFRDALAAQHPSLRPGLKALCSIFGFDIKPWRRIDALSIDATSLSPIGSTGYKLSLSLRNKGSVDVALPWLELSLTDANSMPFARRVISPDALMPRLTYAPAESEQSLSFSFSTGSQRISGYSVIAFHP